MIKIVYSLIYLATPHLPEHEEFTLVVTTQTPLSHTTTDAGWEQLGWEQPQHPFLTGADAGTAIIWGIAMARQAKINSTEANFTFILIRIYKYREVYKY